jgi:hypothetical protein
VKNATSKMFVFADSEVITGEAGTARVERYEALHLGIAIRSSEILQLRLERGPLLRDIVTGAGGTIEDDTHGAS